MLNSLAFCVLAGFLLIYFPPFLGMHRLQASFPHIKEVISFKDIFQPGKVAMSLSTFFFFFFFLVVLWHFVYHCMRYWNMFFHTAAHCSPKLYSKIVFTLFCHISLLHSLKVCLADSVLLYSFK